MKITSNDLLFKTAAANSLVLTKVAETTKTITLAWTPIPCEGYEFLVNGKRVSNTWDQTVAQTRFSKVASGIYQVRALSVAASGTYP